MRKLIKLNLNDGIVDEFNNMLAISNETAEVYINSDYIQQFSFSNHTVTFMQNGSTFRVKFSDKHINEYHRVKREFEEAFGISSDKNENLDEKKEQKRDQKEREIHEVFVKLSSNDIF